MYHLVILYNRQLANVPINICNVNINTAILFYIVRKIYPFFYPYYFLFQIPGCHGSSLFRAFSEHLVHRLHIPQHGPLVCHGFCFIFLELIRSCMLLKYLSRLYASKPKLFGLVCVFVVNFDL